MFVHHVTCHRCRTCDSVVTCWDVHCAGDSHQTSLLSYKKPYLEENTGICLFCEALNLSSVTRGRFLFFWDSTAGKRKNESAVKILGNCRTLGCLMFLFRVKHCLFGVCSVLTWSFWMDFIGHPGFQRTRTTGAFRLHGVKSFLLKTASGSTTETTLLNW